MDIGRAVLPSESVCKLIGLQAVSLQARGNDGQKPVSGQNMAPLSDMQLQVASW